MDEDAAAKLYMQSGLVDIAEKHALRYKNSESNDLLFGDQWGMTMIQAPEAWDITTGDNEVVVAVIDTGVDYNHPDLAENIWSNTAELKGSAGVDDDDNGYVDDIHGWDFAGNGTGEDNDPLGDAGHGTHVAGIIAAGGNNGIGVAGVCWNLKIMPAKIQADNATSMDTWDIIQGMEYAMENGARIINCSYGGPEFVQSEKEMFSLLGDQGILAVCAAGNDGDNIDRLFSNNYPAEYDLDNILAVASNADNGEFFSGSNYGENSVDVMAPGVGIKSTVPAGTYTEAFVETDINGVKNTFSAEGMTFAGLTDEAGITGSLYDCGLGKVPGDFPPGIAGNLALIQRGDIYFSEKTENAMQAGAGGAIIYNNVSRDFSGTLQNPGKWVPVVSTSQADGEMLLSMLDDQPVVTLVNKYSSSSDNYGYMTGTSMATSHVTGLAGLLLSVNPDFDYIGFKSIIMDTVDPVESATDKMVTGGRVNAYAAVAIADDMEDFDSDDDGMGDFWEEDHFSNIVAKDGTDDSDHDGYSDLQEFINYTDPSERNAPGGQGYDPATDDLSISGNIKLNNQKIFISLIIDGKIVDVIEVQTATEDDFSFELPSDPGDGEYTLTAVDNHTYCEITVAGFLPIVDADIDLTPGAPDLIHLTFDDTIEYEETEYTESHPSGLAITFIINVKNIFK